jgi:hypothetical protein
MCSGLSLRTLPVVWLVWRDMRAATRVAKYDVATHYSYDLKFDEEHLFD